VSGGNIPRPPIESTRTDDSVHPSGCTNHRATANGQCHDSLDVPEGGRNLQQTLLEHVRLGAVRLCERGKVRLSQLKVGREGACVNYGLFGRCSGCQCRHEVCPVAISWQVAMVKVMESALAKMKATAGA
jgi:hypothetical protein